MGTPLRIALKAVANDHFVCADRNLNANLPLVANRTAVGGWEQFDLYQVMPDGSLVPLELPAGGGGGGQPQPPDTGGGGQPQPPAGSDMINLASAGVYSSPPDIAGWPITVKVTGVSMHPGPGGDRPGIGFGFDRALPEAWKWPSNPSNPSDNYQYTVWALAKINGVWAAAAFIQMWQGRESTGAEGTFTDDFPRDWAYSSRWGPLYQHRPTVGETMAFFVSAGNGRDQSVVTSVRERSNVVTVVMPSGWNSEWRF